MHFPTVFTLLVPVLSTGLATTQYDSESERGRVYWLDRIAGEVWRADLNDGSNAEAILSDLAHPAGLALDLLAGRIVFTEGNAIKSALLNGSDVQRVVTTGSSHAGALVIDHDGGWLYYLVTVPNSDFANGISRCKLDGSSATTVYTFDSAAVVKSIAVNPWSGWIYWSDSSQNKLMTGRGSSTEKQNFAIMTVSETGTTVVCLAVDHTAEPVKVYWGADGHNADMIRSVDMDQAIGSNQAPTQSNVVLGVPDMLTMAIDQTGGKVYWGDGQTHTIERADLDGGGRETVFSGLINDIKVIAVHPFVTTTTTSTTTSTSASTTSATTTTSTTATTQTTTTATSTTTTTSTCFDSVPSGATDNYVSHCDWYATRQTYCGTADDSDFSANLMCCVCGAGTLLVGQTHPPTQPPTAPVPVPTPVPTAAPSTPHPRASTPLPTPYPPGPTVQFEFVVKNVQYTLLQEFESVQERMEQEMKQAIASEAGNGVTVGHVTLLFSVGSVNVQATIATGGLTVARTSLQWRLQMSVEGGTMAASIAEKVRAVLGIEAVSTGSIRIQSLSVPTVVAAGETLHRPEPTPLPPTRRRRTRRRTNNGGSRTGRLTEGDPKEDSNVFVVVVAVLASIAAVCLCGVAAFLLFRLERVRAKLRVAETRTVYRGFGVTTAVGRPAESQTTEAWRDTPGVVNGFPVGGNQCTE